MKQDPNCGKFLGMVSSQRNRNFAFLPVKVDASCYKDSYFAYNQVKLFTEKTPLYCYYFDSLMTTVREFRTIKCSEFYATSKIILNPVKTLQKIAAKGKLNDTALEDMMLNFISQHQNFFNESQLEALRKVAVMQKKDLLLIQGPVSILLFL